MLTIAQARKFPRLAKKDKVWKNPVYKERLEQPKSYFYPGQKVIAIRSERGDLLTKGKTYTIESVKVYPDRTYGLDIKEDKIEFYLSGTKFKPLSSSRTSYGALNPKYPRISKLRKPYKSTVFFPKTGKFVEVWVVGRVWHKELYESPYSKDLVQLPSGEVIEV